MPRGRDTDACPGALQVHQAADGAMARIRLPGGMITAAQLATLADVSTRLGSGTLELTARGNVQVRGITDVAAVGDAIAAAGLLPSATHERVRNIVASPLSGRVGGNVDVREWVGELDAAICAEPMLAELGGRFWFSLDDGRADVSGLGADAGVHWSRRWLRATAGGERHRHPGGSHRRCQHADRRRDALPRNPWKSLAGKRIG